MKPLIPMRVGLGLLICSVLSVVAADEPKSFQVGEFTFERPSGWTWIRTASAMRAAQLQVGGRGVAEPAEVVFFHFGPGNGGGTQANVERWLGQFQEPKAQLKARIDEQTIRAHAVTFVQAEGTYLSGRPGGPKTAKPNFALLGAIVESKKGSVFVRMTGPAALVKAESTSFRQMIRNALQ